MPPLKSLKATVAASAFDCLEAPMMRIAAPDVRAIAAAEVLEQLYMPNLNKIVVACVRYCKLVCLLRQMVNKYFAPSAPFGRKLVSNTIGSVVLCREDVLATRYPLS
jgi:hypothetical protein